MKRRLKELRKQYASTIIINLDGRGTLDILHEFECQVIDEYRKYRGDFDHKPKE